MAWRRETAEGGRAAEQAGARLARQATASLAGLLAERGMTRKDLADCMGVSPGRVSQILSGGENLTLRSLAAVAESLDARVEISFYDPSDGREPYAPDTACPETAPITPLAPSPHR
ncbi:helix-turn-helix transcriptional regulator [Streptomyces cinnamoneus]|uniref:helix-turn-helix domain-containing protein n=1 Tax=Streptomyces cinnamoneus TaxID=53446 RepID=UPI00344198D7